MLSELERIEGFAEGFRLLCEKHGVYYPRRIQLESQPFFYVDTFNSDDDFSFLLSVASEEEVVIFSRGFEIRASRREVGDER